MAPLPPFIFNEAGLNKLLEAPDGLIGRDLLRRGLRVETAAKDILTQEGQVDTGTLRNSINTRLTRDATGLFAEVGTNVNYSLVQHDGRRGFRASPGKVLAFKPKGSATVIFRKSVGPARGTKYLLRALPAAGG